MKCPICTTVDLVMSERQGVEIDYCPNCRGIWLDRGELDKILDRVQTQEQPGPGYQQPPQQSYPDPRYKGSHDQYHHKRKHWLSELFD